MLVIQLPLEAFGYIVDVHYPGLDQEFAGLQ